MWETKPASETRSIRHKRVSPGVRDPVHSVMPPTAEDCKRHGNDAYKAGSLIKAIEWYTKAVELSPTTAVSPVARVRFDHVGRLMNQSRCTGQISLRPR